jgi:hypothetical protein
MASLCDAHMNGHESPFADQGTYMNIWKGAVSQCIVPSINQTLCLLQYYSWLWFGSRRCLLPLSLPSGVLSPF